jgi:hypothetical protein
MGYRAWSILLVFLMASPPGFAMRLQYESLDRVLMRTRAAIVADVESARESRINDIARELDFRATAVETLFGDRIATGPLDCVYVQGLAHRRGNLTVTPLMSGSGIEFEMKPGDRVILLIGAAPDAETRCNVLRIEPLDRRDAIKQFGAT